MQPLAASLYNLNGSLLVLEPRAVQMMTIRLHFDFALISLCTSLLCGQADKLRDHVSQPSHPLQTVLMNPSLSQSSAPVPKLDRSGVIAASIAYASWGFFPLYWQLLKHISPLETMSHRVIWSCLFYAVIASYRLSTSNFIEQLVSVFRDRRAFGRMVLASLFIGANWLLYVWAVTHEHVLETSLGYFMSPLLSVAIGAFFLKEKLSAFQKLALSFACLGVAWLTFDYGRPPWIAVALALSFSLYGLIKKVIRRDAIVLNVLETLILLVPAIGAAIAIRMWATAPEVELGVLLRSPASLSQMEWVFLILGGAVTGLPLLFFGVAAQRLPLSVIGFFQYISPSLQFLCAVLIFREPLSPNRLLGFALIWVALGVFLSGVARAQIRDRKGVTRG